MKYKVGILLALLGIAVFGVRGANNPHIVTLDLSIDGVDDGKEFLEPAPSTTPSGPGGFVCLGGWKKITLKAVGVNSPMKTRLNWNSDKIEVWTATTDGEQVPNPKLWDDAATMPTELWVKGIDVSDTGPTKDSSGNWLTCGPEHLCLEAINNGDDPTTPGTYYDRIAFTVINIDLEGHWPEVIGTLGPVVTEAEEDDAINLFVAINDDDDNGDGVVDGGGASASTVDTGDDEPAALIVRKVEPSGLTGILELVIPNGLKLFDSSGAVVSSPVTVDLSAPSGQLSGVLAGDVTFLIEATAESDDAAAILKWSACQSGPTVSDEVHATLVRTEVSGGFCRGSVQYAEAQMVPRGIGCGTWVTGAQLGPEYPLSVLVKVVRRLEGASDAGLMYETGTRTGAGVLLNEAYFVSEALFWNIIIRSYYPYWPFPPFTADMIRAGLAAETEISAEDLNAGKYFIVGGVTAPDRYSLTFYKGQKRFRTQPMVVFKVEIKKDEISEPYQTEYLSVTDATRNVLPGQAMRLKAETTFPSGTPDSSCISDYEWTIPPKNFWRWDHSSSSATLVELQPLDLSQQFVYFYWADAGDFREVKCRVKIDTKWCGTAEEHFHVKKPICVMSSHTVYPGVDVLTDPLFPGYGLHFGLVRTDTLPNNDSVKGIRIKGTVVLPQGFSQGYWGFCQTVKTDYWMNDKGGTGGAIQIYKFSKNGVTCCDQDAVAEFYTGPTEGRSTDSPMIRRLENMSEWLSVGTGDGANEFSTYIMLLPPGRFSQWVPLKRLDWWWTGLIWNQGCPSSASWVKVRGDNSQDAASVPVETADHPRWASNIESAALWELVQPPSP